MSVRHAVQNAMEHCLKMKLRHLVVLILAGVFVFLVSDHLLAAIRFGVRLGSINGDPRKTRRYAGQASGEAPVKDVARNASRGVVLPGKDDSIHEDMDRTNNDDDVPATNAFFSHPGYSKADVEKNNLRDERLVDSSSLKEGFSAAESKPFDPVHVVMVLKNAGTNPNLQRKFLITVTSVFEHVSVDLQWHIFGDDASQSIARQALDQQYSGLTLDRRRQFRSRVTLYPIDSVVAKIKPAFEVLMKYFTGKHAYYKDELFFLSTTLHLVLDASIEKVLMLDADLKFMNDIKQLHDLFNSFSPSHLIGIGYELQPVYRHLFWSYRNKHPGTHVGEPRDEDGNPGFNSGVLLLHLERIRNSELFATLCQESTVSSYVAKYDFTNAHLGDQDFYTLTSFEHPELYFRLPCAWNRQLCRWWEDKGYQDIFSLYFDCHEKINVYHGNCDTPIHA